jgi:hypothetical protein
VEVKVCVDPFFENLGKVLLKDFLVDLGGVGDLVFSGENTTDSAVSVDADLVY